MEVGQNEIVVAFVIENLLAFLAALLYLIHRYLRRDKEPPTT